MPLRRGVRRPIFLSAEVSASLQQQYDPPTGNRPPKGVAEFNALACCIFAKHFYHNARHPGP
jgi:hypothetical protein